MYCLSIRSTTQNEGQSAPHQNSNIVSIRLCIEAVRRPSYNLKMMIFWGPYNFSVAIDRRYIFEKIFHFLFFIFIFIYNYPEKSKTAMKSDFSSWTRSRYFFVIKNYRIMYSHISGSEKCNQLRRRQRHVETIIS